jgi:predicted nucleic acid-binding protein
VAQETTRDDALYQRRNHWGNPQGLIVLPRSRRRTDLETWFNTELPIWFSNRVLPVTHSIADRWGVLDGQRQLKGTPLGTADGMIAATALEHDLTRVTRNVKDFAGLGVEIFNPWEAP